MTAFFAQFFIYLATLFSSTAQYRDSGEMATAAHTLGIAHPPGYPLYIMLSKIFILILPFATPIYRLNVLSALSSALAVWMLYKLFIAFAKADNAEETFGLKLAAGISAMVFGTSYLQWYLSLVSEMYTLNTLIAISLLAGLFYTSDNCKPLSVKYLAGLSFLMGIGLGVRMDILLIAPAPLWLLWSRRDELESKIFLFIVGSFLAGFSIFAYLYVRSNTFPMLDWNHPASLEKLWSSIARKTHGGTLDLISESYAPGENFWIGMRFYFSRLFTGLAMLGAPVAAFGLWNLWRRNIQYARATFFAWIAACPMFIYMGNIPPNTHAFAILEAHFLFPNTIIAVWFAYGMYALMRSRGAATAGILSVVMITINVSANLPGNNQRFNFFDYDYTRNILHSTPDMGAVVMKKDVQIFSIWAGQYILMGRTQPAFVAQGLSGSQWYQEPFAKQHPDVFLAPLKSPGDWQVFYKANAKRGPVYFSGDVEYPSVPGLKAEPNGLLNRLTDSSISVLNGELLLREIYAMRGLYDYNGHTDFFTDDLVGDYSHACLESGTALIEQKQCERARSWFNKSLAMQPLLPSAANMIAYSYFMENNFKEALAAYLFAAAQYRDYLSLAEQYRALASVQESIRKDNAEAYMSAGVCLEKMNRFDESLAMYSKALETDPAHARAFFNRGVVYWRRGDWKSVVRELQEALRIDPNYREASYYLQISKQKLK